MYSRPEIWAHGDEVGDPATSASRTSAGGGRRSNEWEDPMLGKTASASKHLMIDVFQNQSGQFLKGPRPWP